MAAGEAEIGDRPDPAKADSTAEFLRELGRLRVLAGDTYRQLQQRTGVPHSTLGDVLTGRRRTRADVVERIVRAYAADDAQAETWTSVWGRLTAAEQTRPGPSDSTGGDSAAVAAADSGSSPGGTGAGGMAADGEDASPHRPQESRRRFRASVLGAVVLLAALVGGTVVVLTGAGRGDASRSDDLSAAGAAQRRLQAQIDLQLMQHPTGRQISRREVSYRDGTFVIAFAPPGQAGPGRPDCPRGSVCVYAGEKYAWPRLQISSCGWHDLSWLNWHDRARSLHNATNSAVDFLNHEDRGDPANLHRLDIRLLTTPAKGARPVMPPATDHIQRTC